MSQYRDILVGLQAKLEMHISDLKSSEAQLAELSTAISELMQAKDVVNTVQLATQITIKDFIEQIVALALKAVFGEEYGFSINYEIKRGKSEAQLFVTKNGELFDAADECGGGVVDVAAFGLRIALFALADPKPRAVLVLDEPGKFISNAGGCVEKFGSMLKEISTLLQIQIICVSHNETLIGLADRAFVVSRENNESQVKLVEN